MIGLIVAVEAAKEAVTVGEDTASGLMFADDFVGISEAPEGLHKQVREGARVHWDMEIDRERKKLCSSCM